MKFPMLKFSLSILFLILFSTISFAGNLNVCETDFLNKKSEFQWQHVRDSIPLYFNQDDKLLFLRQLQDEFIKGLNPLEHEKKFIQDFLKLLSGMTGNREQQLLKFGRDPNSDEWLLSSRRDDITVPCIDKDKTYLIDSVHLVDSLEKIHVISLDLARKFTNERIKKLDLQYSNWFENGLPMWPQESWFNGLLLDESDAQDPPEHQWVLIRPSLGIRGQEHKSLSNNQFNVTLGLELVGYVKYINDDYSKFLGLSLLVIPGNEKGLSCGVLLRYNSLILGYARQVKDLHCFDPEENIFIGVDLYQLFHEKKDRFADFKRKIRNTIERSR